MNELVVQAGLADARLADDGHHLPVTFTRLLQGPSKLLDFLVATHESAESPRHCRLQARPGSPRARHLIDLDRLEQSPHRNRAELAFLRGGVWPPERNTRGE